MPPAGLKPTISAGERPQTYALEYAATGIGNKESLCVVNREMDTELDLEKATYCHCLDYVTVTVGEIPRN